MIWTTAAKKVDGADLCVLLLALEHVVGLHRALDEEEEPADDQHDVAPGQGEAGDR